MLRAQAKVCGHGMLRVLARVCVRMCVRVCVRVFASVCTVYLCVRFCVHVCVCVCFNVCVHVRVQCVIWQCPLTDLEKSKSEVFNDAQQVYVLLGPGDVRAI